jgi:hypothetical protein
MGCCPPSAWDDSWDDPPNNPSAASAIRAITRAIGATSACTACEQTSCKRQVSGSNPLTGSQFSMCGGLVIVNAASRARYTAVTGQTAPLQVTLLQVTLLQVRHEGNHDPFG